MLVVVVGEVLVVVVVGGNQAIDPKISKKCVSYCKIPTQDKKHGTSPQNPTVGPKTYWAALIMVIPKFIVVEVFLVQF